MPIKCIEDLKCSVNIKYFTVSFVRCKIYCDANRRLIIIKQQRQQQTSIPQEWELLQYRNVCCTLQLLRLQPVKMVVSSSVRCDSPPWCLSCGLNRKRTVVRYSGFGASTCDKCYLWWQVFFAFFSFLLGFSAMNKHLSFLPCLYQSLKFCSIQLKPIGIN